MHLTLLDVSCLHSRTPLITQALSTDLHASTRNTIRFFALNRAYLSKFYTYVSRIVVDKPRMLKGFSKSKLKPKGIIFHVNENCLP